MKNSIGKVERELMRGAGVLAVLTLLDQRAMYGYELAEALDRQSEGALAMGHSTLYPMLYNLEAKSLIEPYWRDADTGRKRKYYRLTREGRRWLKVRRGQWTQLVEAMGRLGLNARQAAAGGNR